MGDGIHSNVYMRTVYEKMNAVALQFDPLTDKAAGAVAMRDELQKIAMQLADGTFKVKD